MILLQTHVEQHLGALQSSQLVLVIESPDKHFGPDGGGRFQP